ncbi:hypothetical protein KFL_000790400 [Klebsormidium nitens]|uniref:Uncharacterized protein n=1 Tax=Klebsormidium nitens TaxID=105231 RepID=A0A1Y1HS03_KLENI|nr:hypothetical protein KFL_000790400 [Klebsormidium nitens]|eukprot:GAQ81415.1 hypothetical protein KFL_000790400 [Klebsormidium nitens]
MSDALFGIIREFEGALEGQMRRQREENIQRKREFEKRFLEKELELAERENSWKKDLQRREKSVAEKERYLREEKEAIEREARLLKGEVDPVKDKGVVEIAFGNEQYRCLRQPTRR